MCTPVALEHSCMIASQYQEFFGLVSGAPSLFVNRRPKRNHLSRMAACSEGRLRGARDVPQQEVAAEG